MTDNTTKGLITYRISKNGSYGPVNNWSNPKVLAIDWKRDCDQMSDQLRVSQRDTHVLKSQSGSEFESDPLSCRIGFQDFSDCESYKLGSGIEVAALNVMIYCPGLFFADSDIHLNVSSHSDTEQYVSYHLLQSKAINSINDIKSSICNMRREILC